jgi:hypothetical protein
LGAAVSQGRESDLWRAGDPGPTPEAPGMREALNLSTRHTDNADADLCPYQPLIPTMFLSPRVIVYPFRGRD